MAKSSAGRTLIKSRAGTLRAKTTAPSGRSLLQAQKVGYTTGQFLVANRHIRTANSSARQLYKVQRGLMMNERITESRTRSLKAALRGRRDSRKIIRNARSGRDLIRVPGRAGYTINKRGQYVPQRGKLGMPALSAAVQKQMFGKTITKMYPTRKNRYFNANSKRQMANLAKGPYGKQSVGHAFRARGVGNAIRAEKGENLRGKARRNIRTRRDSKGRFAGSY